MRARIERVAHTQREVTASALERERDAAAQCELAEPAERDAAAAARARERAVRVTLLSFFGYRCLAKLYFCIETC